MSYKEKKLYLPKKEYDRLMACCQDGYVCPSEDGCEYDEEAVFSNGYRMAVQVCRANEEACWTQGVLFDKDGFELGCTHACDDISGTFEVEEDGTTYAVTIEVKP